MMIIMFVSFYGVVKAGEMLRKFNQERDKGCCTNNKRLSLSMISSKSRLGDKEGLENP